MRRSALTVVRGGQEDMEGYYLAKIMDILFQYPCEFNASPARVLPHLYIGSYQDAENVRSLRQHGITHVLNCAAFRASKQSPYPSSSGVVAYEQFAADDTDAYDILQHFSVARAFIERARQAGGKCLVHCAMGVNRSGAICTAYLIDVGRMPLLDAVRKMKRARGTVLCNRGFQRKLIRFAKQRDLI